MGRINMDIQTEDIAYNKEMISEAGMMIGDKVRIRKNPSCLVEGEGNPMDTDGIVTKMYRGMCYILYITVEWDNGEQGWYIPNDLDVIHNLLEDV